MKKILTFLFVAIMLSACSNHGMYFSNTKKLPGVGKVQVKRAMFGTIETCKTYDGTLYTSRFMMKKQNFYNPKKRY